MKQTLINLLYYCGYILAIYLLIVLLEFLTPYFDLAFMWTINNPENFIKITIGIILISGFIIYNNVMKQLNKPSKPRKRVQTDKATKI